MSDHTALVARLERLANWLDSFVDEPMRARVTVSEAKTVREAIAALAPAANIPQLQPVAFRVLSDSEMDEMNAKIRAGLPPMRVIPAGADVSADPAAASAPEGHKRTCPAYGNYQPPYEQCDCGAGAAVTPKALDCSAKLAETVAASDASVQDIAAIAWECVKQCADHQPPPVMCVRHQLEAEALVAALRCPNQADIQPAMISGFTEPAQSVRPDIEPDKSEDDKMPTCPMCGAQLGPQHRPAAVRNILAMTRPALSDEVLREAHAETRRVFEAVDGATAPREAAKQAADYMLEVLLAVLARQQEQG